MPKRFSQLSAVLAIGLVLVAGDASAQFGFGFGGGGFGGGGFGGFGRGGGGGFGGFGRGGGGFGGGQMGRDGGFGRRGGGGAFGDSMGGRGMNGGRGMGQRGPGQGGMGQAGRGTGQGRGAGQGRGTAQGGYGSGRGTGGGRPQMQKPGTRPDYAQRPPQRPPQRPYPPQRPTYPRPPVIVHNPRPVFPILPPVAIAPPVLPRNPAPAYQPPAAPPAIRPVFNPPPPRQPTAAPPATAPIVAAATDEGPFVPKEILVTTLAQASPDQIQAFERRLGLTPLSSQRIELLGVDLRRYRVPDNATVGASVAGLAGDPAIRLAQPNFWFDLTQAADTAAPTAPQVGQAPPQAADALPAPDTQPGAAAQPERPVQYAIDAMKLDAAHRVSTGANVLVAVIDSGIDETNPDIAGSVVDRFDAVGGTFAPQAHGTAMAGVIVAHQYLRGIAPQARVLAIRAFAGSGPGPKGTSYDIVRGLDFAASRGAQIVNMSFAGPRDALLAEALMAARTRGMIEIAAAGNAGPSSPPLYPAAEPGVIAITATDAQNGFFAKANRGAYVAAAAPGVDILAPSVGATMQLTSGTSVAAAEASGVVALLLQGRQNVSADIVRRVLAQSSAPLPGQASPGDVLIDASAALQAMPPETAQPQTAVRFVPGQAPPAGPPAAVTPAAAAR